MNRLSRVAAVAALLVPTVGQAEVTAQSAAGFTLAQRVEVKAAPEKLFEAIGHVDRWWNPEHTYSGEAANLKLELSAGSCFCERWGGNSVAHAHVVNVIRDKLVRMDGALGPLQELAVTGIWTLAIGVVEGKTVLRVTYRVVGPADAGLERWPAKVDEVLSMQTARLVAYAETGKPTP
jgi:uncharacterized protein YndB with AHSA1/START domain